MTLNVTVVTPKLIYQCADYRMTNMRSRAPEAGGIQKLFIVNTPKWSATVSFAGVARYGPIDVAKWFASKIRDIKQRDPLERLIDDLLTAESWLRLVPPPANRHSFSVGAFVGSHPKFILISNFERPGGLADATASLHLNVHEVYPTKAKVFVAGEKWAVSRTTRRRLERLAETDPGDQRMYDELAAINRMAANLCSTVSMSCYTSHLRLTGEGGGHFHHIETESHVPAQPMGAMLGMSEEVIRKIIDEHCGPGRTVGLSIFRLAGTEEDHQVQLREKPSNPHVHNNYGVFLKNKQKDSAGAEREYRKALELDPNHTSALINLADLLTERSENAEAEDLYERALKASPGDENVSFNFARYLLWVNDLPRAKEVLDAGVARNPQSSRLLSLRADYHLSKRDGDSALADFLLAREAGGDQKQIEAGIAYALHLNGAPIDECINAYRTAIALDTDQASLTLNLSQLLFIKGFSQEARKLLRSSLSSNLDASASLEGQFYRLAHTDDATEDIFHTSKKLLGSGGRLRWDVAQTIDAAACGNEKKAEHLKRVAKILEGDEDISRLEVHMRLAREG